MRCLPEDPLGLVERRADRRGDRAGRFVIAVVQRAVEAALELQVAVGDDADEPAVASTIGTPEMLEARHQRVSPRAASRSGPSVIGFRIIPLSRPLHAVHLGRLAVDRHVLVHHPDAARARHRDRHLGLGHGIHRRGDERDVQRDAAGEARRGVDVLRVRHRVAGDSRTSSKVSATSARTRDAPFAASEREGPLSAGGCAAGRELERIVVAMAKRRRRDGRSPVRGSG